MGGDNVANNITDKNITNQKYNHFQPIFDEKYNFLLFPTKNKIIFDQKHNFFGYIYYRYIFSGFIIRVIFTPHIVLANIFSQLLQNKIQKFKNHD